jgi:hypothetical protein
MEMQQYESDQKAYEAERDRESRLEIAKLNGTRMSAAMAKDAAKQTETYMQNEQRIGTLDTLIDDLTAAGDNISGPLDGTIFSLWDRARGNPEANLRLRMEDVRVNAALTKVEQTKGAISDREMSLFLSPMPKMTDGEGVWIDWMTMQRNIATRMNQVAKAGLDSSGTRYLNAVDKDAPLSAELEAYLAKYPPK